MNELAVVDKGADWRRLKALVLDSVSSRSRLVRPGAAAGLRRGDGGRLARRPGGPQPGLAFRSHSGSRCGQSAASESRPAAED